MQSDAADTPIAAPLRALLGKLREVRVPRGNAQAFVLLGTIALFLMATEAVTGVLLALYFRPAVADANASVRFVVTEVHYGALVRALHLYAADALIVLLVGALAGALLRRAYRAPNGVAWACGVALLFVVVLEAFTGGMLPWTRRSVVDAAVSSNLAEHVPFIGRWLRELMLGGARTGDLALVRVLGLHAGALPMLATATLAVLALHGAGAAPRHGTPGAANGAQPLFPHVVLRGAVLCSGVAMVLITFAALSPPGLGGGTPDGQVLAAGVQPAWYLRFVHDLLRAAPPTLLGAASASVIATLLTLLAVLAVVFPALDRKASRVGQVFALLVLALIAGGTFRALLS
jgi:quinol-cytochrome oxidoreductase complex cytochrome b subunit